MTAYSIFVFCDDPTHPQRRVAVDTFDAIDAGLFPGWTARSGRSGATLVGDDPAVTGWANDPEVANAEVRERYDLRCRLCKQKPVPVRQENLFRALDTCRSLGVSEVALTQIATILQEQSERERSG